ncbi:MAG TPA: GNAT family protein [Chitinophagaceae bacterium]|nr:GNAT family protein [Chitinophagaceae bacterium]
MIQGDGFILRPFRLTDKKSLVKHANNKKISDNLRDRFPHPYTEEGAEWFITHVLSDNDPVKNFVIEINGEAAGAIGITPDDDVYRLNGEMGYWLGEEYWGKGIMTAVIKATVKYGFENLGIKRIYAIPFATTIGSIKALEKAGFIKEATICNGVIKNNKILDYHIYSITSFDK